MVKSNTCYLASPSAYKRFTISEEAANWHELMIPQHTMRPSIARVNERLDPWFAASRHTTAQSATLNLYPVARNCFISHPTEGKRLSLGLPSES